MTIAKNILDNTPCFYLPIYENKRPDTVNILAEEGFATVIRLPLKSSKSAELTAKQINLLVQRTEPLNLFLERIEQIAIVHHNVHTEILSRKEVSQYQINSSTFLQKVVLGDDDYLIGNLTLDEKEFHEKLEYGIENDELPEAWKDWEGKAIVSVAVNLSRPACNGLMYCYLPLGSHGDSPFCGYINANFYTSLDRRSLIDDVALNDFFITKSAHLCSSMIDFLIEKNWKESPSAVLDLMCWEEPYSNEIREALGFTTSLPNKPLLPVLNEKGRHWVSISKVSIWDYECKHLCVENYKGVGKLKFLIPSLSTEQVTSLDEFLGWRHSFNPEPKDVAHWVEVLAKNLLLVNATKEQWAQFYNEIAEVMHFDSKHLFGKKIFLSANGTLVAAEKEETEGIENKKGNKRHQFDLYLPPTQRSSGESSDMDETEDIPESIQKRFALLSGSIDWSDNDNGCCFAKDYFVRSNLIEEYKTREIMRTLSNITRKEQDSNIKSAAFEWAFKLWLSGRSVSDRDFSLLNFYVPTSNGWVSAKTAMFGDGWSKARNGKKLQSFLKKAAPLSKQLSVCLNGLIPSYKKWPFSTGDESSWLTFLIRVGVRDHFRVIYNERRDSSDVNVNSLAGSLANKIKSLNDDCMSMWLECMKQEQRRAYYQRSYKASLTLWSLPGLFEYILFQDEIEIRKLYAEQLIFTLISGEVDTDKLHFSVSRFGNNDDMNWQSPLAVVLRNTPWMPVKTKDNGILFSPPKEAFYFESEDESAPGFIEFIYPSISRLIDHTNSDSIEKLIGLRALNNESLDSFKLLEVLSEAATFEISGRNNVKRFTQMFSFAWRQIANHKKSTFLTSIPVVKGDSISVIDTESESKGVVGYIVDEDNSSKLSLMEELGIPYFNFGKGVEDETKEWLLVLAEGRFKNLSEENLVVLLDGCELSSSNYGTLIADEFGEWIIDFLVCIAGTKAGSFFSVTQNTLSMVRHLAKNMRIVVANNVELSITNKISRLPGSLRGALMFWYQESPILVLESIDSLTPSIEQLAEAASQIALGLGNQNLSSPIESCFLRLLREPELPKGRFANKRFLSNVLRVDDQDIQDARAFLVGDLDSIVRFAVVVSIALDLNHSYDYLEQLSDNATELSDEEVDNLLIPIAQKLKVEIEVLKQRFTEVIEPGDLMELFEISLVNLNVALDILNDFHPISFATEHERQLEFYISQHKESILKVIRQYFITEFDTNSSLDRYVLVKNSINLIKVNPDWAFKYTEIPEDKLEGLIEEWISQEVSSTPIEGKVELLNLSSLQDRNRRALSEFWNLFGKVISTWVANTQDDVPPLVVETWSDPVNKRIIVISQIMEDGWLDFRLLDNELIIKLFIKYGFWPEGKPLSTVLSDWGIDEEAIKENDSAIKEKKQKEKDKRKQIDFGGKTYSAEPDDFMDLAQAVKDSFDDSTVFDSAQNGLSNLSDVGKSKHSGGQGGGGGSSSKPDAVMSDEQKLAIGLAGEIYAGEWIKQYHRKVHNIEVNDDSWVSKYRDRILATDKGDDSLGYDFIVKLKTVTYYYEVKASQGNSYAFQMGPTEIAHAQRCTADKKQKYRVLYVSNVGHSSKTKIDFLPNPFSKAGSTKIRLVGKGSVTFKFDLES